MDCLSAIDSMPQTSKKGTFTTFKADQWLLPRDFEGKAGQCVIVVNVKSAFVTDVSSWWDVTQAAKVLVSLCDDGKTGGRGVTGGTNVAGRLGNIDIVVHANPFEAGGNGVGVSLGGSGGAEPVDVF